MHAVVDRAEALMHAELTREQQRRPLHEKWVITEKKTPEGVFEKIKARMVVLGNLQTDE